VTEQTCACVSEDAYECWRLRYDLEDMVEDDGPCDCPCHDWPEEHDYDV